jgi:hypothetical protein
MTVSDEHSSQTVGKMHPPVSRQIVPIDDQMQPDQR